MKRITVFTFASMIAACSSSAPGGSSSAAVQPTTEDLDDTAQAIGTVTMSRGIGGGAGDVVSMSDAMILARGELPFGFALRASDKHFHGSRMGVDNSFTVTCKDAAGATLDRCDRTTDQAQIDVSWSGSWKTPMFASEVSRDGTWTLTGLQSDTATLDGSSTFSLDSTVTSIFRQGVTSSLSIDASAMYSAIQIATANHQPIGGSAAFSLTVHKTVTGTGSSGDDGSNGSGSGGSGSDGSGSGSGSDGSGSGSDDSGHGHGGGLHDVDKTFTVTATITFTGDATADLVLNGTDHFTIDLNTGAITRA